MNKKSLIILGSVVIVATTFWKGCRYIYNPHYASNDAVSMGASLYNLDSSAAVVNYTLDKGALGDASYQTLLRKDDYQGNLSEFMLPAEYIEPKWRGNDTLEVIYDEGAAYRRGGNTTNVDKTKDNLLLNEIVIIVKERRMNRKETIRKDMESNGFHYNDSIKLKGS